MGENDRAGRGRKKNKIHNDDEVRQECEMIGSARGRGSWVS